MGSYRKDRINEDVKKVISGIISGLKDPRVPLVTTVTQVKVTPDLKYAKIYVSMLGDAEARKAGMEGIKSASGFIRRELSRIMNLRITPELTFVLDESLDNAVRINEILEKLDIREDVADVEEDEKGQ